MAKAKKKATHGGAGRGQGRHLKYGEETKIVCTKVPKSKEKAFKANAQAFLSQYIKNPK